MVYREIICLNRAPHLSPIEFRNYYENKHVPLVLSLGDPAYKPISYTRHYVVTSDQSSPPSFDVITELGFTNKETYDLWNASVSLKGGPNVMLDDVKKFVDLSKEPLKSVVESYGGQL
ncbi:hypothetical protein FDECE_3457 [Fusarium decemcellulare]|nr:hypothetical protein FDECE_3457 [Fusarium decemcellulare]